MMENGLLKAHCCRGVLGTNKGNVKICLLMVFKTYIGKIEQL